MPAMPDPRVKINKRLTGRRRYRCEFISGGSYFHRDGRDVVLLQLEWCQDIQNCNSRAIEGTEAFWQDAHPNDVISMSPLANEAATVRSAP